MSGGTTLSGSAVPEAGYRRRGDRLAALLAAAAVAAMAALVAYGLWGFSYDDAFVTYRYADNLAAGHGLVFNPGEAVLGTTAAGWAVVLAAATRAGHAIGLTSMDVAGWATLLSVLSLALVTGFLPLVALRRAPPPWPWAFPLLFTAVAFTQPWCLQLLGAETWPVLALGTVSAWLALGPGWTGRRETGAGLLMAAAMVLRLDAALGALAVGLVLWAWRRRLPWRYGLAGVVPLVAWLVWLQVHFGGIVPATLAAKRSEAMGGRLGWIDYTRAEWHWLHRDLPRAGALWLVGLAAVGGVVLVGWLAWVWGGLRAQRGGDTGIAGAVWVTGLVGWVALQEVAYRVVGVPFAPWYHLHLVLALLAIAIGGCLAIGRAVGVRDLPRRSWRLDVFVVSITLMLFIAPLSSGTVYLAGTWRRPPDGRQAMYAAVGRYLRQTAPPGATVAAVEIGALGYFGDRPVLDLVGLVDPPVVAARREGRLAALVRQRDPRYVLVPPQFRPGLLGPLLADPALTDRYRPIVFFTDPDYQGGTVTLYERHPLRFATAGSFTP